MNGSCSRAEPLNAVSTERARADTLQALRMVAALIIAVAVCPVLTALYISCDAWALFAPQFELIKTAIDIPPNFSPPPPPPPPGGINLNSYLHKPAIKPSRLHVA